MPGHRSIFSPALPIAGCQADTAVTRDDDRSTIGDRAPRATDSPRLAWEVCRLDRSLGPHGPRIDALNQRLAGGHPLFDSRFVGALLRHFGSGKERLALFGESGDCHGLCLLKPLGRGFWSTFQPAQSPISPLLADRRPHLGGLFKALPGMPLAIDFLGQDPQYSPLRDKLTDRGLSIPHTLTMSIELDGDFNGYWRQRPANLIKNVRRYQNRLTRLAARTRFLRIADYPSMADAVRRYGHLESTGWKGEQGTAVSTDNVQGRFYTDILESFAATGQASIYEYWIDDQLAASRLVVENPHMLLILKTAYNESLAAFAPGRLLLFEVIRDAFARLPRGSIEFYTNATPEQLAWATHQRLIKHHTVFRSEAHAQVWQCARAARRWSRPTVKPTDVSLRQLAPGEDLPPAYQTLFAKAEEQSFDLGWPWLRNFSSTVEDDSGTATIYASEVDGHPHAALPVRLSPNEARPSRIKALSNYYTSLYAPVLAPGGSVKDLVPLIVAMADRHPSATVMEFAPLDPESPSTNALRNALTEAGWITLSHFCFGNWYLPVTGSWQDYLAGLNGQTRNTLRRMGRKFAAAGGSLEVVVEPSDLGSAIDAFQEVYAKSWKLPEPHPRFIPGLIRMLADSGRLRLGIAWLDQKPIAAQLWIVQQGKASIYKLAYNEEFARYSPGTLLTAQLMERVIDQDKVGEVDFLSGDDAYKQSWMTHRRERWGLVAYNTRSAGGLIGLARAYLIRTARWILRQTKPGAAPRRPNKNAEAVSTGQLTDVAGSKPPCPPATASQPAPEDRPLPLSSRRPG